MWNIIASKLSQKWVKNEVNKKWDEIIKWEQNEVNYYKVNYHKINKYKKYIFYFQYFLLCHNNHIIKLIFSSTFWKIILKSMKMSEHMLSIISKIITAHEYHQALINDVAELM